MRTIFCFSIFVFLIAAPASAEEDDSVWFKTYEQIDYSELRRLIDEEQVDSALVSTSGWWVTIKTKEGEFFDTRVTPQTPIADHLYAAGVPVRIEHRNQEDDERPYWSSLALKFSPLLVLWVFLIFLFVAARGYNRKILKKNDDHLEKAEKLNNDHLVKVEAMQKEFFDRLEKLLTEKHKE